MQDLDFARQRLKEGELTLVIVKEGEVLFETDSPGIGGFLNAIEAIGKGLSGSSVADRIVGRAIALLCVYSRVKEVFAVVLSREGLKVFEEHGVRCEFENIVPNIRDAKGARTCPYERLASTISSPDEAYEKLRALADSLR